MNVELSIIIPSYNESKNLLIFLNKISKILSTNIDYKKTVEVIFVNNGSSDETADILKVHHLVKTKIIKTLNIKKNNGYGNGILEGIKIAHGKCIAWTHADNQTDVIDIINAFNINKIDLINSSILVKGLRLKRNWIDTFLTKGMSFFVLIVLGYNVSDINAQPKIFNASIKKLFVEPPLDFSLDLYLLLLARKNCIPIVEYPVYFNKRLFGVSKGGGSIIGKMRLILRTMNYIIKIKKKWK